MALAVVGVSHRTAPIEVRERFAFGREAGLAALRALVGSGAAREAVLLSTCNRTELYLRDGRDGRGLEVGASLLARQAGLGEAEAERFFYRHRGRRGIEHLFRVVASLDSMILGETQIQGQVRAAYEEASRLAGAEAVVGPVLSRLFETALAVGGRVRSETRLGEGAASVPSAAVELARKVFGPLRDRSAVVLGTGEMAELMARCLVGEGVRRVTVVGREGAHAAALAGRLGVEWASFDGLEGVLAGVDVVAAATAAPHVVLTRERMERAFPGGPPRRLVVLDIALPRDVDPAVGELENVFLYDIDDLEQVVEGTLERRRAEVAVAERIVAEGVAEFWSWYRGRAAVPLVRALRGRAEAVRRSEAERALRRLGHLSEADRAVVDQLTRRLLAKWLHEPTVRLRDAAADGRAARILAAARYLFGLERDGGG